MVDSVEQPGIMAKLRGSNYIVATYRMMMQSVNENATYSLYEMDADVERKTYDYDGGFPAIGLLVS